LDVDHRRALVRCPALGKLRSLLSLAQQLTLGITLAAMVYGGW
jgi:hypothetical protein